MGRNVTVSHVTLTKNEKVALALKILGFIMPYSTQKGVMKIVSQNWDAVPFSLDTWAVVMPDCVSAAGAHKTVLTSHFSPCGPHCKSRCK